MYLYIYIYIYYIRKDQIISNNINTYKLLPVSCFRNCQTLHAKWNCVHTKTYQLTSLNRFYKHVKSFRDRDNETELSKYIWQLNDDSENYNICWKIFIYATPYKSGTTRCDLCPTEKFVIARADQEYLLKKRNEIISKCCPRNKYSTKNIN